jgi:radical SAM protein with 4Fe4S-binding SPASM domain
MDLGLFGSIVSQLKAKLTEVVVLHSDGEPLLNEKLFKMISMLKKQNICVMTSTNATLLNKEYAAKIINSGLDILTISIDGTSGEVYERIRRGSDFNLVMKNIHSFLKAKGSKPPFTTIQMIIMKENEHQANEFTQKWKAFRRINVHPVIKPMMNWFEERPEIIKKQNYCDRPWFGMLVHSNGNVVPCVHDFDGQKILGKLPQDNIYDIWNSDNMVGLRHSILNGRRTNDLCNKCNATSPRKFGLVSSIGLSIFDMGTIAKMLSIVGYHRPKQY